MNYSFFFPQVKGSLKPVCEYPYHFLSFKKIELIYKNLNISITGSDPSMNGLDPSIIGIDPSMTDQLLR